MTTPTLRLAAALLFAVLSTTAGAGVVEISDDINARIARAKGQQATVASDRARDAAGNAGTLTSSGLTAIGSAGAAGAAGAGRAAGCNIAIGNVFEDRARAGVSTSARRETTVIVTGDVIQVGNNCR